MAERKEFAVSEAKVAQVTKEFVEIGEKHNLEPWETAVILKLAHELLAQMLGMTEAGPIKKVWKT